MQAPPPMMRVPMDRNRLVVLAAIGLGLFFLMAGAILSDMSNSRVNGETTDQQFARENLGLVWGPAIAHVGMFFFVGGLFLAAIVLEEMDPFVRLFLLILGFVALLLVLANSPTLFGPR